MLRRSYAAPQHDMVIRLIVLTHKIKPIRTEKVDKGLKNQVC